MKTDIKCIDCFTAQLLSVIERLEVSSDDREFYVSEISGIISHVDYSVPAPVSAKKMYSAISEMTGNNDPFREIKLNSNNLGRKIVQDVDEMLSSSGMTPDEKFISTVKYLISANIIDYGAHTDLTEEIILKEFKNLNNISIDMTSVDSFKNDLKKAKNVLYIGDNAGEVFMDAYFIKNYMSSKNVTFCTRGIPVINDITEEDALAAGIDGYASIITTEDNTPGVDISSMPEKLVKAFSVADLVIAKGQGNFETLGEQGIQQKISMIYNVEIDCPVYCLFKVKCDHVSNYVQKSKGTMAILKFY
ncbi:MAG: DUF89 family protein [Spirochaetes bacterium]|nr:DUF89 family protein [Spirochaetota bacterium]